MQTPTHILAGVIIQKSLDSPRHRVASRVLIAVTAFLSHGILDKLANLTYHLANPDFRSPTWVGYHLTLIVVTVVFLYIWWRPFKWGIIFGSLPDVDWVFIHGQEIFHVQIPFYRHPHFHRLLGWLLDNTPPFSWLNKLPNLRHQPAALLNELVFMGLLVWVVCWLGSRAKRAPAPAAAATKPAG